MQLENGSLGANKAYLIPSGKIELKESPPKTTSKTTCVANLKKYPPPKVFFKKAKHAISYCNIIQFLFHAISWIGCIFSVICIKDSTKNPLTKIAFFSSMKPLLTKAKNT